MRQLDRYLEQMGVQDSRARQRLTAALPGTDGNAVLQATRISGPEQLLVPMNNVAKCNPRLEPLFIVCDSDLALLQPDLSDAIRAQERACYGLVMPPQSQLLELQTMHQLTQAFAVAIKSRVPAGPYLLGGIGAGAVVAHSVAVRLQQSGYQVPVLVLFEDSRLREAADMMQQPWFKVFHFVQNWRRDLDMESYKEMGSTLALQGFNRQIEWLQSLCPDHVIQVSML